MPKRCWFIVLLLPATALYAQKMHVGINAGLVLSGAHIEWAPDINVIHTKLKAGTMAGLFALIPAGKHLSIRPAVAYVRKGVWVHERRNGYWGNPDPYVARFSLAFNYLDIPVNILYEIKTRDNKVLVGGGPVLSFSLNDRHNYNIAKTDAGINLMTGYEWPIGFSVNLHFTKGFKNVSVDKTQQRVLRNYYAALTIGYWF